MTEATFPQITLNGIALANAAIPTPELRPKILVVDDSAVVRRSFCSSLSTNYECEQASDAMEAIHMLRASTYDLVITDIIMPGLSGIELLRKIVDEYPDTAVLVVSGVDRPQRALDAVRLGAFDYLIKPCEPDVLQLTVERALERGWLIKNAKKYKQDLEARNEELVRGKKQLERLQTQIIQSEKMASLGQLAAGIAHELNNPVGFVYGNLELLEGCIRDLMKLINFYEELELDPESGEKAAELKKSIGFDQTLEDLSSIISDCREGTVRVRDIVQNLRTFSRLDEAEFKKTDIHEGIDSTVRLLSRYFSRGNIRLLREYGDIPSIDAYSAQLNQVWTNLLVNAAQAVGDSVGDVTIRTRLEGPSVVIEISDTGIGIPPDVVNRIFDPFFTTKAVGEGTGLGLTITFGIIERHGGRILVDSRPGEGTTFKVELPVNLRPAARTEEVE